MNRYRHQIAAVLLAVICVAASGCGGSSSLVRFDGVPNASITLPMLNHWMNSMAGGDFHQSIGAPGPEGLVSEPADYPRCVRASKLVAAKTPSGRQEFTDAELEGKCRLLHRALKEQALSFLISVQWTVAEGERRGVKVTGADIRRAFAAERKNHYPTEADLRKFLAGYHWALSDIFYQLKRNIIVTRTQPSFQDAVRLAGGQRAFAAAVLARQKAQIAKTSCKPGYVVPTCREYRKGASEPPVPAVLMEELVKGKASARSQRG